MSCSMRIRVIEGSRPSSSSVSSTRSPRERPEAGSSSISIRGSRRERHRDRDLTVLAVREVADALAELVVDRDPARGLARPLAQLRVAPEDQRPQAPSLDADDGEVDAVLDRQPEKLARLLVRACEPELDARPGRARA